MQATSTLTTKLGSLSLLVFPTIHCSQESSRLNFSLASLFLLYSIPHVTIHLLVPVFHKPPPVTSQRTP